MKKTLIPITFASVFTAPLICTACNSQSQATGALCWNILKDGDYKHFSPKGEYPSPYQSKQPVDPANVWQLYFEQKPITNMLGNDIIYNQLGVYSTTPKDTDITITPFVIKADAQNNTISYAVNIDEQDNESKHKISIFVDNLHYDVLDNEYGIYFSTDWLTDAQSLYWEYDSWQIIFWMDGVKTTINSVLQWTEWTNPETAANWTAIKPYYCKDITLAK